jgi:hypothetical protein
VHEDLVAHGLVVEELARLGIRRAHEPGEQIRRLPERAGVHAGAHERVGRPEQFLVLAAVGFPARALRGPGEEREVGAGIGDAPDALLRPRRQLNRDSSET